ncbi:hypothetical protein F5884DRAFT_769457 [Xylogone sp. PMI_703]|nr:hypothetical protein F5884DRAFT_769457 [Xylogone sp. PMI_703]
MMASPILKHTARSVLDAFFAAERVYMSAPPETRDFIGITLTLSPDFRLEQTSGLPYAGTYIGPKGMQEWGQKMAGYFDVVDVQDAEVFEKEASDRVVVVSNLHLRVRKTGEELYYPFCQVVKVDLERGVIEEMRPFYWDVQALNKAVGCSQ